VALCRDYHAAMFVFDTACSQLRPEKEFYLLDAIKACRHFSPDLVVNCRGFNLSDELSIPYYNSISNDKADFWLDDLVWQSFGVSPALAPGISGALWLLNDDEFSKIARLFTIHKKYNDCLTSGFKLPILQFGSFASSRGNGNTRFITINNPSWQTKHYKIELDSTIGLAESENLEEVRYIYPVERLAGKFKRGAEIDIEIEPHRSCMIIVSTVPINEPAIAGCDYHVERNIPKKPVRINLFGLPGKDYPIKLIDSRKYKQAFLDGKPLDKITKGKITRIRFSGKPVKESQNRKLADLSEIEIPKNIEQIYRAAIQTAYAEEKDIGFHKQDKPSQYSQVNSIRKIFNSDTIAFNKDNKTKIAPDLNSIIIDKVYHSSIVLDELSQKSSFINTVVGKTDVDGILAFIKSQDEIIKAINQVQPDSINSYNILIPINNSMVGKKVDIFLIGYKQKAKSQKITIQPIDHKPLKASLWITQYPIQNMQKSLVLYE